MLRRDIEDIILKNSNQISKDKKYHVWDEKYTAIKNWWDITKEKTHELGDTATETVQNEPRVKDRSIWCQAWVSCGWYVHDHSLQRREMRRQSKIFEEIMVKTFSNLMKTTNPSISEDWQIPGMRGWMWRKGRTFFLVSHSSKTPVRMKSTSGVRAPSQGAFPCHELGHSSCRLQSKWFSSLPQSPRKGSWSPFPPKS